MAISRSADSGESDPCTMFSPISSARSPRIVPGAESSGLVAPIIVRTVATAAGPSITIATTGPGGDELHQPVEERLALVLGVVLVGLLGRDPDQLHAADAKPALLEPAQHLGRQPPLDGVRLDHDEGALDVQPRGRDGSLATVREPGVLGVVGGGIVDTGVSQCGHSRQAGSSGALQRRQAFFSLVPQ